MPSVILVIAAVLMTGPCALAQAQCDQYCAIIKRALDDRKNNFGGLKGKQMGNFSDAWWTNISPPEMTCRLLYHHDYKAPMSSHPKLEPYWQFYCRTRDDLTNGKQHLKSVFSAFRQIEPKWKWFKSDEGMSIDYWGGPAANELYASVGFTEIGENSVTSFELHSTPITVYTANLPSYSP